MAVTKIPGGLYTGGAVTVNTEPIAQMYEQYNQRAMARDQALDNYFRDLNKSVTPAGMRNQEVAPFMEKQKEWQNFYLQNKQAIKNPKLDNGKAFSEYNGRYNDMIAYANQSKNAQRVTEQLDKLRENPNMGHVFDDDEIMHKIQAHDKPIGSPEHQDLNIAELMIPPKPLSIKDMEDLNKTWTTGIKPVDTVTGTKVDPTTLDTITSYKRSYSPEDLQAVGNRAKYSYQLNRSLRVSTDKNLINSPDAPQLNEIYKSVYGKNAESPADLLAAQAIQNAQTQSTYDKRTPGSFEQKRLLEQLKQGNRQANIRLRFQFQQMGKQMDDVWVENHVNSLISDAQKNQAWNINNLGNNSGQYHPVSLDAVTAKALARQDGKIEPDQVMISPDGNKILPVFYQYDNDKKLANGKDNPDYGKPLKDENGKFKVDANLSIPISKDQLKLAISGKTQSAKQRAQEMQQPNTNQQFVVPRTHKGMLD